jgi:hypothetical protein
MVLRTSHAALLFGLPGIVLANVLGGICGHTVDLKLIDIPALAGVIFVTAVDMYKRRGTTTTGFHTSHAALASLGLVFVTNGLSSACGNTVDLQAVDWTSIIVSLTAMFLDIKKRFNTITIPGTQAVSPVPSTTNGVATIAKGVVTSAPAPTVTGS